MASQDVRWCRIEVDGRPAHGLVDESEVAMIDAPPYETHRKTGRKFVYRAARLLPPVVPNNFYAAGVNFRGHAEWASRHLGVALKLPVTPDIEYRSPNALIGSGHDIVIPRDAPGPLHFEGELVAIIGRRVRNVPEEHAIDCVAGYTLGNDLVDRGFQKSDRTLWRARNSDTFKPMGPLVATGIDPMDQVITVRVNGREAASYSTSGALFSLSQFIARISTYATLWPGDVIWLGSDGPTLPALEHGDLVEVMNDAIGILANRVIKA